MLVLSKQHTLKIGAKESPTLRYEYGANSVQVISFYSVNLELFANNDAPYLFGFKPQFHCSCIWKFENDVFIC